MKRIYFLLATLFFICLVTIVFTSKYTLEEKRAMPVHASRIVKRKTPNLKDLLPKTR